MKSPKVHYTSSPDVMPECNPMSADLITPDESLVTCLRCKNTRVFKSRCKGRK